MCLELCVFSASLANSRSRANLPVESLYSLARVNHVFCETKQEILLRHMGIMYIHGYCHARVHAGVTPLYIFFSSFLVSSRCSC